MHVIWDWNGTLLDDTAACVETLNLMLVKRGGKPVTMEFFRRNFSFPARRFYELVGMDVRDEDWDALALEYHRTYLQQRVKLNDETLAALETVKKTGNRQSVLSALRQDLLDAKMREYDLKGYFEHIVGSDNLDGGSKLERAKEFAASLRGEEAVLIGDSLHDAEVARAMGVRCVLCSQGSHSHERLVAAAPTAVDLLGALRLAGLTNSSEI